VISGGAGSHNLVRQFLADSTGLPVIATEAAEPVLLGSTILGAVAAEHYNDIPTAMAAMSCAQNSFELATREMRAWHNRAFTAFETLQTVAFAVQKRKLSSVFGSLGGIFSAWPAKLEPKCIDVFNASTVHQFFLK
jgi:D-ribulokinase